MAQKRRPVEKSGFTAMLAAPLSQAAGDSSNISAKQLQEMILPFTRQIENFHKRERVAKESMGQQQLEYAPAKAGAD